ncbi:UNVERIFIED_CONTAM: hypothetical protein Scaly_2051400 [Sesamum calycinum]|uniref:Uncharacterized protein n=1 Tax=Sesamum calycinum TaxID=2727403 RepID=A0AAW2N449_9LAMI
MNLSKDGLKMGRNMGCLPVSVASYLVSDIVQKQAFRINSGIKLKVWDANLWNQRIWIVQIFGTKESGFWKPEKTWIQSISTDEVRLLLKKFVSSYTFALKPDCAFASILYGGSKVDDDALQHATDVVNIVLKEAFTIDQNRLRWEKLRERCETFSYLINRQEIHWDRWDNKIHAPSAFWEQVFQVYSIAKAYEHFGEPNFSARRAMFQSPTLPNASVSGDRASSSHQSVKHEVVYVDDDDNSNEVVEVSSGSEEL